MSKRLAASLLFAFLVFAQEASVWTGQQLDSSKPGELRSGPGYSIQLRRATREESHAGDPADRMLWIREGSGSITAGGRAAAEAGDVIRIPARTPWSIEPRMPIEFLEVRVAPLAPGRAAPPGIRPAPGHMAIRASRASIERTIAATEANAPLHTQDNFTANFVLFKGRVGPWESHAHCADIYFVQTGEGMIETGGSIVNAKDVSPGEPRGTAVQGASRHPVGRGTLIVIPRGVAHHMNPQTLPLAYILVKVWAE